MVASLRSNVLLLLLTFVASLFATTCLGQFVPGAKPKPEPPKKPSRFGDPPGAKRISPKDDVWIDTKRHLVIFDGRVCLREGLLEMFICPKGTKEHESIISANTKAFLVHAALLSVGAEQGKPVQFDPMYTPATGAKIEIRLLWIDKDGKKHTERAQDWIRNTETKKAMTYPWVFAGSSFWTDEGTGKRHYQAEAGDLVCVSNFPSATLDLPVESSQGNQSLLFEAFTEHIPPLDTEVRVVLIPEIKKKGEPKDGQKKPSGEEKKSVEGEKKPVANEKKSEAGEKK